MNKKVEWKEKKTSLGNAIIIGAVLLIVGISVYNMGFIFYCRKKRNFIETNSCGLKVYSINHSSAPFLLGNKIYLSDSLTADMKKYAICHEYCHYKHGDMFWNIIRYFVLAVNFYNPIVWYAFVLSEQDCELACDESVLKSFGSEQSVEYGKVLLELLANKSTGKHDFYLSTAMNGRNKRFMKERIVSIKSNRKYSIAPICLTIAIVIAITGCSLIKAKPEDAQLNSEEVTSVEEENYNTPDLSEAVTDSKIDDENEVIDESDSNVIMELSDGMYTVTMSGTNAWIDGVQVCSVYPWTQIEFDQDYVDSLKIGNKIDFVDCAFSYVDEDGNTNKLENLEVTEVTAMKSNPVTLYGTEYDGNMVMINKDFSVYLMKVADSDTWKLFSDNDTPLCIMGEEMNIKLSDDITIYDGYSVFANTSEENELTYEEQLAIAEFKDKENAYTINSTNDFIGFENRSFYDYTVINVENNEVTEIYFWYHP